MSNPQLEAANTWLKSAWYDLEQAKKIGRDSIERGILCYHAQQCAEKSVKSVFIAKGIEFKKFHDSSYLSKTLVDAQIAFPFSLELATLSAYLTARYPGEVCDIEERDRIDAAKMAEDIYQWASHLVARS
jgi:HEPN domain-containing protein